MWHRRRVCWRCSRNRSNGSNTLVRLLTGLALLASRDHRSGLLPKGTKYDLFRGAAQVAVAEEEKFPDKNVKVIKANTLSLDSIASSCVFLVVRQEVAPGSRALLARWPISRLRCALATSRKDAAEMRFRQWCRQFGRFHRSVGLRHGQTRQGAQIPSRGELYFNQLLSLTHLHLNDTHAHRMSS